jgi:Ca2+-binding EF-hand superfamily protein
MAELLFIKFNQLKSGEITRIEFLQAFEIMVKGSFEEKADVLFEFYGVENSGGIRYSELLKIVKTTLNSAV